MTDPCARPPTAKTSHPTSSDGWPATPTSSPSSSTATASPSTSAARADWPPANNARPYERCTPHADTRTVRSGSGRAGSITSTGGTTSARPEPGEPAALCRHHHLVHEGGWTLDRRGPHLTLRRPDGSPPSEGVTDRPQPAPARRRSAAVEADRLARRRPRGRRRDGGRRPALVRAAVPRARRSDRPTADQCRGQPTPGQDVERGPRLEPPTQIAAATPAGLRSGEPMSTGAADLSRSGPGPTTSALATAEEPTESAEDVTEATASATTAAATEQSAEDVAEPTEAATVTTAVLLGRRGAGTHARRGGRRRRRRRRRRRPPPPPPPPNDLPRYDISIGASSGSSLAIRPAPPPRSRPGHRDHPARRRAG